MIVSHQIPENLQGRDLALYRAKAASLSAFWASVSRPIDQQTRWALERISRKYARLFVELSGGAA